MPNSRKEFEDWIAADEGVNKYGLTLRDSYKYGAEQGWQACNAKWERKLDEGELIKLIRNVADSYDADDAMDIAQAIIKHLKGE